MLHRVKQAVVRWEYAYAIAPLAGTLLCNMITYFGSRLVNRGLPHYDLTLPLDGQIPFAPWAMSVYVLSFLFWGVGFLVIARESRAVCYRTLAGEQIAKLMCLACFLLLPTTMERPEVTGSGFFPWLTRLIYRLDSPDNLFPSIHCLESWICLRGSLRCKKVGRGYQIFCLVFALMVCASTLLVKQHVAVDVVSGIAVAELGLRISQGLRAGRIYEKWNRTWKL